MHYDVCYLSSPLCKPICWSNHEPKKKNYMRSTTSQEDLTLDMLWLVCGRKVYEKGKQLSCPSYAHNKKRKYINLDDNNTSNMSRQEGRAQKKLANCCAPSCPAGGSYLLFEKNIKKYIIITQLEKIICSGGVLQVEMFSFPLSLWVLLTSGKLKIGSWMENSGLRTKIFFSFCPHLRPEEHKTMW